MPQPGPPLDLNTMADLFLQRNMVREATAFLLEVLNDNDPKNGVLQTKLLEINLVTNPQARGGGGGGAACAARGRQPGQQGWLRGPTGPSRGRGAAAAAPACLLQPA
jgi:hypothetical protein